MTDKFVLTQFRTGVIATVFCSLSTHSLAGSGMSEIRTPAEKLTEPWISGEIAVDIVSQYVFRGVIYENQGAIVQPSLTLAFLLYRGEGFLNEVRFSMATWNSFHSRKTDAGAATSGDNHAVRDWYEFDLTVGFDITFARKLTLTPSFLWYASPNGGFDDFYGLDWRLAYDDSDLLGVFALHPYVELLFELQNKTGSGADEGIHYEVGIAPARTLGPLAVAVPLKAGFGASDYYAGNAAFGYVSAGLALGYTFAFIPVKAGIWSISASVTYYRFGDAGAAATNVKNAQDQSWVFGGGMKVKF